MLPSYYLNHAKEVWNDIVRMSSSRTNPEVLIAVKIEKVVKSMLEKTQGHKLPETTRAKIRCGVVGSGQTARTLICLLEQSGYEVIAAYEHDALRAKATDRIFWDGEGNGVPVVRTLDPLLPYYVGLSGPADKEALLLSRKEIIFLGNGVYHSSSHYCPDALLEPGSTVGAFSWVGANARIGRLVAIDSHAHIGSDVVIGDFCTLGPKVTVSTGCQIGSGAKIGAGVIICPRVLIGAGVTIRPGEVVTESIYQSIH